VFLLIVTYLAFSYFHYLWLPRWWVRPGGNPFQAAFYFIGAAFILFIDLLIVWSYTHGLLRLGRFRTALWSLAALIPILLAVLHVPTRTAFQLTAARQAGPLLNAIQQYRDDHGTVPEKLEQLVPQYIEKLPTPGLRLRQMDRFVYEPTPLDEDPEVPFVLAFGLHVGGIGGDFAVVYCPVGASGARRQMHGAQFTVPLPVSVEPGRTWRAYVEFVRRLGRSWILAESE
jgi:hypothetical protein